MPRRTYPPKNQRNRRGRPGKWFAGRIIRKPFSESFKQEFEGMIMPHSEGKRKKSRREPR